MIPTRGIWLLAGIVAILAALVFLWWAIQTVWLGSFPGRDTELYSRWAAIQFVLFMASLVLAIVAFVKHGRRSR